VIVPALKFVEVGARAVFILLTTYSLDLKEAGQFGLLVTLQGLASFAFGYERHVDVMRRRNHASPLQFDRLVSQAAVLQSVNGLLVVPVFIAIVCLVIPLSPALVGLCAFIAFAEQWMNNAYHLAVVDNRYRAMLINAALRSLGLATTCILAVVDGEIDLTTTIQAWALVSAFGFVSQVMIWRYFRSEFTSTESAFVFLNRQYRASFTHFAIGLVAVLTLQAERLVAGAVMSFQSAGVYFRHVVLLSMIYQLLSIASYNRVLPRIYAFSDPSALPSLLALVRREYRNVVFAIVVFGALLLVGFAALGSRLEAEFKLNIFFFLSMLVVAAIRSRADLNSLIFNALHREKLVFQMQFVSVIVTVTFALVLAYKFAIPGLIAAGGIGSVTYLFMSTRAIRLL
jgi:hypothetical protein